MRYAGVLELADRLDQGSSAGNGVWVQVPSPASFFQEKALMGLSFFMFWGRPTNIAHISVQPLYMQGHFN